MCKVLLASLLTLLLPLSAYADSPPEEAFPNPADAEEFKPIEVGRNNELFLEAHIQARVARALRHSGGAGAASRPPEIVVNTPRGATGPVEVHVNVCSPNFESGVSRLALVCTTNGLVVRAGGGD